MSNLLAVFGSTGHQGSSVINHVLNDPELSQRYKIRALARDVTSEKARSLSKDVQVVAADMTDLSSIQSALAGVHTAFIMTMPSIGPGAMEAELNTAKMLADTAVEQGVEYIIFSTLPAVSAISHGKYTAVTAFDAKAKAEEYIRTLPVKSAFVSFGFFMDNVMTQPFCAPRLAADGVRYLERPQSPQSKVPYVDAIRDAGKFVGAILAEPDKYQGKTVLATQAFYTMEQVAEVFSKGTGQRIKFKQVSDEEFRSRFDAPWGVDMFSDAFRFCGEYGYYGPDGEEGVAWAAANARGKLATLEEFFQANPFKFE